MVAEFKREDFLETEVQTHREFVTEEQLNQWNSEGYDIEMYGKDISLVIIGEGHNNDEEQKKQIELIRIVKPEYVLHEFLRGWIYNPETKKLEKQGGRIFNQDDNDPYNINIPLELLAIANEAGFKIIGCDLTGGEFAENQYTKLSSREKKFNIDDWEYKIAFIKRESWPLRDKQMIKTILEYRDKSSKPIVSIMGYHHGDNINNQKILQKRGFSYAYIDQKKDKEEK